MTLIAQVEYARRIGISKAAITQWKNAGRLVLQGLLVDVEATDAYQKRYHREVLKRLDELDFKQAFGWSVSEKRTRTAKAAQCLLWEAAE